MSKVIGIDLGTTNSCMAFLDNNEPVIIPNSFGDRLTPSVVSFIEDEILVGKPAKNQAIINEKHTIKSIKRKMGSNYKAKIGKKEYAPQEISAFILKQLKEDAQRYLGEEVRDAVITVPAYFSDAQRQATKDAGRIAGLNVLRIINEPTAAALAYGIGKSSEKTLLVYDLGGGTFDISILEISDGVFEVKATAGNNQLGGDDFDMAIVNFIAEQYKEENDIDLRKDKMSLQKLVEAAERAKIELSAREKTEINIPFISADENGAKHLQTELTREQFEELISEYIDETIALTQRAIEDAGITTEEIDEVILVGGSTRIPYVIKRVEELVGSKIRFNINPDEVVAMGAAIETGIIEGDITGVVLADVNSLSLGIEIEGGIFIPIIARNTPIPATGRRLFTTVADNQTTVEIKVYQGERPRCSDNIFLGKFRLEDIRPAPKGTPRIEVTFDIDVEGIVHVSAMDLDTGNKQDVVIADRIGMDEETINKLIKEAEEHKHEDHILLKKLSYARSINTLIEKIQENVLSSPNLEPEVGEEFANAVNDAREIASSDDIEAMEDTIANLEYILSEYENSILIPQG